MVDTLRHQWDEHAPIYDRALAPLESSLLGAYRRLLLGHARGRVLDVAAGTGANLPHLRNADQVVCLDLSAEMLARCSPIVVRIQGDASELPFLCDSFDTTVSALSGCTFPDPLRAFREMRRVTRPGGSVLLLEHVRSSFGPLATLQEIATPFQARRIGCHFDRETVDIVQQAGFTLVASRRHFMGVLALIVARV